MAPGTYTFHEAWLQQVTSRTDITFKSKTDTVEVLMLAKKTLRSEKTTVLLVMCNSNCRPTKDDDDPKALLTAKVNGGTKSRELKIKDLQKATRQKAQAVENWTSEAGKSKELNNQALTLSARKQLNRYLKVTDITFKSN